MIILFGTKGRTSVAKTGVFFCPQCRTEQPYSHKRVRRFFTLFFTPVIPLDLLGEYIECHRCSGTFRPEVLDYDQRRSLREFEAEYRRAIRRVMVMMMMADGRTADEEVEIIRGIYGRLTGVDLSLEDVKHEIIQARKEPRNVLDYLSRVSPFLSVSGKELIVKAAYLVSVADGALDEDELRFHVSVARALDISPAHFKAIISKMGDG